MAIARAVELGVAVAGVFAAFGAFAVAQEDVYKRTYGDGRFAATFFVLACERAVNCAFALLGLTLVGGSGVVVPRRDVLSSGASQMLAMAASNEALRYVSYPTQVLGKSCKMVPVVVGGLVLGGRTFTASQYMSTAFITIGVVVFNLGADARRASGVDSAYGLTLIGVSLVMDAITGGLQDRVKRSTKALNQGRANARPSVYESMLYTNLSGAVVAVGFALVTRQMETGLRACLEHAELARAVLVYSFASAIGQNFIYYTITNFDVLVLTTVTTTRKIFSTVYSVFRDPSNELNRTQWFGCSLVFTFLALDAVTSSLRSGVARKTADVTKSAPSKSQKALDSASSTTIRRRSARRAS